MPSRKEYSKQYYLDNKERIKKRDALRYQLKKEEICAKTNSYYHENKDKRLEWKNKNKEKLAEYFKMHYNSNPELKEIKKKRNRKNRFKNYQITEEQYKDLFEQQSGKCLGCGTHQDDLSKKLCVDHCHETGKIRGLLCTPCNLAIGLVKDDVDVLQNLINYLSKP